MNDAVIDGYARALFEVARAEGTLDEVEDELFRFARSYESSDALRSALTDDMVPAGVAIKLSLRDYVRPGDARGADSAQLLTPTIVRVERS